MRFIVLMLLAMVSSGAAAGWVPYRFLQRMQLMLNWPAAEQHVRRCNHSQ